MLSVDCLGSNVAFDARPCAADVLEWWFHSSLETQKLPFGSKLVKRFTGSWSDLGGNPHKHVDPQLTLANMALDTVEQRSLVLVRSLLHCADGRGSDIRLDTGIPYRARAWPRVSINAERWVWRTVCAWPWRSAQHINELELLTILQLVQWRARSSANLWSKFFVLCDNQVCLAVITKGRSSSRRVNRILCRLNALCLASFSVLNLGFIRSAANPADAPSRLKW